MATTCQKANDTMIKQSEEIILEVSRLADELSKFSSYEPDPNLDEVLSSISRLCHQTDVSPRVEDEVLNDPRIISLLPRLRALWAEAAGALEDFWARRILTSGSREQAKVLLESYPRIANYRVTIPIELGVISIVYGSFPSTIAMLGSGPLPLTSISIVDAAAEKGYSIRVLNIDIEPERIRDSERIFGLLGDSYHGVSHQVSDAAGGLPDLTGYDAVYVASLVGSSDVDKIQILKNTARYMRKGAVIVVRSSSGLSRLLWPSLQTSHFNQMKEVLRPALAAQPLDGPTKHSVVVLRVVA